MLFFPFGWAQGILPKVHLRRSMMIYNTTKVKYKQFLKINNKQVQFFSSREISFPFTIAS